MGEGNGHLEGRVVVVTGGGGGFGRLIGEMAAARGAKVVLGDVDGAAAEATAAAIAEGGGEAIGVAVDVRDLGQVEGLVARAVERFGAVDVMVNNAGVMPLAFFRDHQQAREAWDRCIDINLKGVLHGIVAVHDRMVEQGRGHVVNIASIYANAGTAGSGVYSATKAAVVALSDSLRVESQGTIKVTVVRPTGVLGTGLAAGRGQRGGLHRERDGVPGRSARRPQDRHRRPRLLGHRPRGHRGRGGPRHRPALGRHHRRRHHPGHRGAVRHLRGRSPVVV
jgi:NAD(P)-dependent dehydrogenase (short-subunit alcohol dehydrogenase family)